MGINRMGPPCPNCGSLLTDVTSTLRTPEQGFWRSRKCPSCQHGFTTVQQPEMITVEDSIKWLRDYVGKKRIPQVNWSMYEAG